MTPRLELRKPGSLLLIAGLVLSLSVCATSDGTAADDVSAVEAITEVMPGTDSVSPPAPAKFFTINAVLAKLDRQQGRGPGAIRLAALSPPNFATDALPPQKEAPPAGKEPFGLFTFRAPDGLLWRKWRGVQAAMSKEQAVLDQCRSNPENCPSHAAQFQRLINAVKSKSGRAKLDEANRAVNTAIRYVSDHALHGEADRWSPPLATFAIAKGDCEDYAIAKYVALSEAGLPREDLQLVLVRDRAVRQDHAVLAARLDGRWLILDNRHSRLVDDSDASSFSPLFAINHDGVHLFAAPYAKRQLLTGEVEAAPAAAGSDFIAWSGLEMSNESASRLGSLPLLM
ncbi:MAG: transglutaminase-like cysteine peptidase [Alphaproteobacteria bacterium]|nr:transglutaminase-like cysteine peptidase [Alphaproteobacteria bacterium]